MDQTQERLASLEAKLEFMKELLKEIRDDLKTQPTRNEFDEVAKRVSLLEKAQTSMLIKVGVSSGLLTLVITLLVEWLNKR